METKLELKYLLPYLTHQLKVRQIPITDLYFDKIVELNGLFISENCATFEKGVDYYFEDDEPDIEIKPLLIPLSALTDEHKKSLSDYDQSIIGNYLYDGGKFSLPLLQKLSFYGADFLASKHYDVFNLIPSGLALNKNDYGK